MSSPLCSDDLEEKVRPSGIQIVQSQKPCSMVRSPQDLATRWTSQPLRPAPVAGLSTLVEVPRQHGWWG
jgi:hypothetical protein